MKMLAMLRHARAAPDLPGGNDFDRPLDESGREAAQRLGQELKIRGKRFDLVLASAAVRVRETVAELAQGYAEELPVRFEPELYSATATTLLGMVRALSDEFHAPLIVGHNPTMQQIVLDLTDADPQGRRGQVAAGFPTAALAMVALPAQHWREVAPGQGEISELILANSLEG
jgi:phosphohistidine phosphatase